MQDVKEAKIQFERGSALYKVGEYEEAADAFNEVSMCILSPHGPRPDSDDRPSHSVTHHANPDSPCAGLSCTSTRTASRRPESK